MPQSVAVENIILKEKTLYLVENSNIQAKKRLAVKLVTHYVFS